MYIIQDACIFYQWYFHIIKADNVHFLYNKYLIAAFCQTSGSIYDIFLTIQELPLLKRPGSYYKDTAPWLQTT